MRINQSKVALETGGELAGGILISLGLFTRLAAIILIIDMLVIIFIMGNGNIFGDEQLPFLLMTLFIAALLQGGGEWSRPSFFQ